MEDIDLELGTPSAALIKLISEYQGDILVLGAGGKMGLHLSLQLDRALKDSGNPGRVLAVSRFRDAESRQTFESRGIRIIPCDLSDSSAVARLPETDAVYFLAGAKFGTSDDSGLLNRINVEVPRIVASRFRRSRIVALSTGCVYPFVEPESGGSTESDDTGPVGAYALSCQGREQAFEEASRNHQARSTLIRLSYSCEYRYGVLVDIANYVLTGKAVPLDTGYANVIWQSEALDLCARALELASSPPCVLNVTGPEISSIRKVALRFGEIFGRDVSFSGTESRTAWLLNSNKAYRLLGYPHVTVEEMIERVAKWIQSGGGFLGKPTKFDVRDGQF